MSADPTGIPNWWAGALTTLELDPQFARRRSQDRAAALLDEAFRSRKHVAIEAPTGTGKTAISLMAAQNNGYRTIISTATRALQDQIRMKDAPHLQGVGLLTRRAVVLQGRNRYYCRRRANAAMNDANPVDMRIIAKLLKTDGEMREDLPPMPDRIWAKVCSDADGCRILKCDAGSCAYTRTRDAARSADIVVVNHHVLLADALIKAGSGVAWGKRSAEPEERMNNAVLGPYRNLIIDEAHALEAAAESFGERRVPLRGILALATRLKKHPFGKRSVAHLAECRAEVSMVIASLPQECLITPTGISHLEKAWRSAKKAGTAIRGGATPDEEMHNEMLAMLCFGLADRLKAIDQALGTGEDELGPRAPSCDKESITSQLVDASGWLQSHLFDHVPTAAMSGTLAVPGRRDFVTERIGLRTRVHELETAFDLKSQRMVYVTPRADIGGGARVGDADVAELKELLDASRGRALVLFPANQDLRFVHDQLQKDIFFNHQLLAQGVTSEPTEDGDGPAAGRSRRTSGDMVPVPTAELARRFAEDTHSVLLATRTFFEGIDLPGETCSLVVIMRYPNLRPDDPLTLARRRLIESTGGNAWTQYQAPAMQILFKQAAGRVIRRIDDKGVVAVLDPRSGSKGYAKQALIGLSPSKYVDDLESVREFLA